MTELSPRWLSILAKVQANILVQPGPLSTPCHIWQGPTDGEQGYPRMSLDGSTVKVHRVMYMQYNGYLPPKKHVDHKCCLRLCCNPDHLEAVTHRQNQRRKRHRTPESLVQLGDFEVTGEIIAYFDWGFDSWTRLELPTYGLEDPLQIPAVIESLSPTDDS